MKVILLEDVKNVGKKHEIVEVSDGYATNFLVKTKKAVIYTQKSKAILEKDLEIIESNEQQKILEASLLKDELEKKIFKFSLKVNNLRTFGSITNKQIIDEINSEQKLISKHMITKPHSLGIGDHYVDVELHKKVIAKIKIVVESEN